MVKLYQLSNFALRRLKSVRRCQESLFESSTKDWRHLWTAVSFVGLVIEKRWADSRQSIHGAGIYANIKGGILMGSMLPYITAAPWMLWGSQTVWILDSLGKILGKQSKQSITEKLPTSLWTLDPPLERPGCRCCIGWAVLQESNDHPQDKWQHDGSQESNPVI